MQVFFGQLRTCPAEVAWKNEYHWDYCSSVHRLTFRSAVATPERDVHFRLHCQRWYLTKWQ